MNSDPTYTNVSTLGLISSPITKGEPALDVSLAKDERWVVIFGAGASRAANQALPLDRDFLESQVKEVEGRPFLHEALSILYGKHWRDESLENAWTEIDDNYNNPKVRLHTSHVWWIFDNLGRLADAEQSLKVKYYGWYRDSHLRFSPAKYLFMFAGWDLRNLVADTYRNARMDQQIYQHLYTKLPNKDITVVSLNYDLIAENALKRPWFYAVIQEPERKDAVKVLKPHGSVNWIHAIPLDEPADRIFREEQPPAPRFGFTDDLFRQPSVIGLVRTKREFGPDEQSLAVRYVYGAILHELGGVIARATHILVVGCSFAPGDQHIQATFNSARQRRAAGLPLKVGYIGKAENDESEEKSRWRARLEGIFGTFPVDPNLNGFCKDSIDEVMRKMLVA